MHAYSIPRASRVQAVLTNSAKTMCHVAPEFLGVFLSLYDMVVAERKLFFAFLSIYYSESFFTSLKVSSIYWNIQEHTSVLHSLTQLISLVF